MTLYYLLYVLIASGLGIIGYSYFKKKQQAKELKVEDIPKKEPLNLDLIQKYKDKIPNKPTDPVIETPKKEYDITALCNSIIDLYFSAYEPDKEFDIKQELHRLLVKLKAALRYEKERNLLDKQ